MKNRRAQDAAESVLPIWSLRIVREGDSPLSHFQIRRPAQAAEVFCQFIHDRDREHFVVMPLTTKNVPICLNIVSVGGIDSVAISMREVYKPCIAANATGLIVAHNHPSGDPTPSPEDVALTREIVKAGKLLDIDLLDHLVVGDQRFVSLKERHLGFEVTP